MSDISKFINIGFTNIMSADKIVSIISPESAPAKRLVQNYKENLKVVDVTHGRKTRAIIITNSGFIILSALQPETILQRINNK